MGFKGLGHSGQGVSWQSWALTALLHHDFSADEKNLFRLFEQSEALPGRLYALFLIHERAPHHYSRMKGLLREDMEKEIVYLADIVQHPRVRDVLLWIEDGRFYKRHILELNDFLESRAHWNLGLSANDLFYHRSALGMHFE